MLHLTNGDSAAGIIRASGVAGEVVPWRDVLHEGPVPAGLELDALSAVRAEFIAGDGWGEAEAIRNEFAARDAALKASSREDEVVLWFEHDLYDQLQLSQLLHFYAGQGALPARLSLICNDEYLGLSTPARLAERFAARQPVTPAQLGAGAAAWTAFRAPDPRGLERNAAQESPLAYLPAALRRHLEQFPSTRNGLSRSEQQALEVLEPGPLTLREAFPAAHHRREEPVWLGDMTFASYLEEMAAETTPLLTLSGDGPDLMARTAALTGAGREVMRGEADRVVLNGLDRWLGGVHLLGTIPAWRWDAGAGRLVAGA